MFHNIWTEALIYLRRIKSLCVSLIRYEALEAIYLFRRETKKKKTTVDKLLNGWRLPRLQGGEEYESVVPHIICLLITSLSLIPVMSGAGLCSDSVTGMTAGLVLIRNDQRPGYKHKHTHIHNTHTHMSLSHTHTYTRHAQTRHMHLFVTVAGDLRNNIVSFVKQIAASAS